MASTVKNSVDLANQEIALVAMVKTLAKLSTAAAAKGRAEHEVELALCRQKIQKLKTPAQRINILTRRLAIKFLERIAVNSIN